MSKLLNLGQWIKEQRKKLDITQLELAERVGCSVMTIRKFENNTRKPSKQLTELLADALAIPIADRENFIATARRTIEFKEILTNLPTHLSPFVGRQTELQQICYWLNNPECRLLTLLGSGGIGKTRLAIKAAEMMHSRFHDGIFLVSLAPLNAPEHIGLAICEAIGFSLHQDGDGATQLIDFLTEKNMLLILDNFEHLLDDLSLIQAILNHAPYVKIIVTSWERLKLSGEWVLGMNGLTFPENGSFQANADLQSITEFDAVQLFVQLAKRVDPQFALTDNNFSHVIRICQLIGGMPLAIELAAGWLSTISCQQVMAYIAEDLDFLQTQIRDIPDRHQSLRAIFERLWQLLSATERQDFMRISIFRDSFDLEAAQAITQISLISLRSLVDKSLVHSVAHERYGIHEFLRKFAYEQLEASGELAKVEANFVAFYVALAKASQHGLKSMERMDWVQKLKVEMVHIRLIRQWCELGKVPLEDELILLGAPWVYWSWYEKNIADVNQWIDAVLARIDALQNIETLVVCYTIGSVSYSQGRYELGLSILTEGVRLCRERNQRDTLAYLLAGKGITILTLGNPIDALPHLEESIALIRELREDWFLPIALMGFGNNLLALGELDKATIAFEEALSIAEKYNNTWEIGLTLYFASNCSIMQGDYAKARLQIEQAITIQHNTDHVWSLANLWDALGHILREEGNLAQAEDTFEESLIMYQFQGNKRNQANVLISLGRLALLRHNYEIGYQRLEEALLLCQQIQHDSGIKSCLNTLGNAFIQQGDCEQAAYLLGYAEKLMQDVYDPLHAHLYFETPYDYAVAKELITQAGYFDAWHTGQSTSLEEIMTMVALPTQHN